jgi:hypothetical protein
MDRTGAACSQKITKANCPGTGQGKGQGCQLDLRAPQPGEASTRPGARNAYRRVNKARDFCRPPSAGSPTSRQPPDGWRAPSGDQAGLFRLNSRSGSRAARRRGTRRSSRSRASPGTRSGWGHVRHRRWPPRAARPGLPSPRWRGPRWSTCKGTTHSIWSFATPAPVMTDFGHPRARGAAGVEIPYIDGCVWPRLTPVERPSHEK